MEHAPNEVLIVLKNPSQAAAFFEWFRHQGGLEDFMATTVAHELPETLVTSSKPKADRRFFFFHFK